MRVNGVCIVDCFSLGSGPLGYIATKAGTLRLEAQRMDMPMEIIDTETDRTFDLSQGAL